MGAGTQVAKHHLTIYFKVTYLTQGGVITPRNNHQAFRSNLSVACGGARGLSWACAYARARRLSVPRRGAPVLSWAGAGKSTKDGEGVIWS